MSFQEHVRKIAGRSDSDYERVLRAVDQSNKITPSGDSARLQQLAITLDSLEAAAQELARFQGLDTKDDDAAERQIAGNLLTAIGSDMNALNQALYETWPLARLATSIGELQAEIGKVKEFEVTPNKIATGGTNADGDESASAEDSKPSKNDAVLGQLEQVHQEFHRQKSTLIAKIREVPEALPVDPRMPAEEAAVRSEAIQGLHGLAKRLEDLELPVYQNIKNGDAGHAPALPVFDGEIAPVYEQNAQESAAIANELTTQLERLKDHAWISPDDRALNNTLDDFQIATQDYRSVLDRFTATMRGSGEVAVVEASAKFDTALKELRNAIIEQQPAFREYTSLSGPVIKLSAAARQLGLLETTAKTRYRDEDGAEEQGNRANDELAQLQTLLAGSVQELQETINEGVVTRPIAMALRNDPQANQNAQTIWSQYEGLAALNWVNIMTGGLLPSFQRLATMSDQALTVILVLLLGALGSLIYMTKEELQLIMRRPEGKAMREVFPFAWYVFRPVFGAVIAFAIYLIYKTGQLALGAGNAAPLDSQVNIPILSVFSLLAGLLAWQTLQMIEQRGIAWLGTAQRQNLFASGLERVLRDAGRTAEQCAAQVGRSLGQVERWIAGADKVTPELQDRIATWLEVPIHTVFTDRMRSGEDRPRWAKPELAVAVKRHPVYQLPETLAEALGVGTERLAAWLDGDEPVPAAAQWRLIELLTLPHDRLFEFDDASTDGWAVGLRAALDANPDIDVAAMVQKIGVTNDIIRDWMELQTFVPAKHRQPLADALTVSQPQLFRAMRPDANYFAWTGGMRGLVEDSEAIARHLDLDVLRVRDWLEADEARGPIARPTQRAIERLMTVRVPDFFTRDRDRLEWVTLASDVRLALGNKIDSATIDAVASALDVEPERLLGWRKRPVPMLRASADAVLDYIQWPADDRGQAIVATD